MFHHYFFLNNNIPYTDIICLGWIGVDEGMKDVCEYINCKKYKCH